MAVYNYRHLYETYYKPIEFDLTKPNNMSKDNIILPGNNSIEFKKYGSTTLGNDLLDVNMQTHIELFDKEKTLFIRRSNDLIKEYNKLIDLNIDTLMYNLDNNNAGYGSVEWVANQMSDIMRSTGMSVNEIRDFLKKGFFKELKSRQQIEMLLRLRTNYCDSITKILTEMLQQNYELIGFGYSEFREIEKELNSGNNISPSTMKVIRDKLSSNINRFLVYDKNCIDMTKLGLKAKIFLSPENNEKPIINASIFYNKNNTVQKDNRSTAIDMLLQKSALYDCIILCHGGFCNFSLEDSEDETAVKTNPLTRNFYKLCKRENKSFKYIVDAITNNGTNTVWGAQAISINGGPYQQSMNLLVADAIAAGYRDILICNCNPGGYELDDVLVNQRGVRIVYSTLDNLLESSELDDEIMQSINETEDSLRKICEDLSIEYDKLLDDNYDRFYPIEEDLKYNVKWVVKQGIEFILSLFKKVINLIKTIYANIKKVFDNMKNKKSKLKTPLEIPLIVLENASIKTYKISSLNDLEKYSTQNIKKIQNEITKLQNEQSAAMKPMQDYINNSSSDSIVEDVQITVVI